MDLRGDRMSITIEKNQHQGRRRNLQSNIFGRWHYYYSSLRGKISLVRFVDLYPHNWEIYCLRGDLFDDVRRFDTKQGAEVYIYTVLADPIWVMIKQTYYDIKRMVMRWKK